MAATLHARDIRQHDATGDAPLLALAAQFTARYHAWKQARAKDSAERTEAENDPACPPHACPADDREEFDRWCAFVRARLTIPHGEIERLGRDVGRLARAIGRMPAHTPAGILAKLRIVALAYGNGRNDGDDDLEACQPIRAGWLAAAMKDLERLATADEGVAAA